MKVAIIVPVFLTGGAENMASLLALELHRQQVDVEVISMYPRQDHPFEKRLEEAGIPLHYMDKDGKGSIAALARLWKCLNGIRPDVVHTHIYATFYAIPWVLLHRVIQVHTIHTCPGKDFPRKLNRLLSFMTRLRKMVLVAVSEKNRELGVTYYGVTEEWVRCVNNPVDIARFRKTEREEDGLVVFANVSRQDENKNQIMAIRALKNILPQVPEARLLLVGSGPRHSYLQQEVRAMGLASLVELPGETARPEDFLARADVYVSTSNNEGLPLSMLEAEAAGLPVIATKVGGVGDIVRDNGALIAPEDQAALEREMLRFARDGQLRKRCGEASKAIVCEYDASGCARKYTEIYEMFAPGRK